VFALCFTSYTMLNAPMPKQSPNSISSFICTIRIQ
jgi:hypothetical protein